MKYSILKKRPEIFLSLFGVKACEFEIILGKVSLLWDQEVIGQYANQGRFFKCGLAEMVLLLLLYYRHYITQEFVGMLFGLHKSRCIVPYCGGDINVLTSQDKEEICARYYTVAPGRQRRSVGQSKIVKRA
jgi:hypothetical protein